MEKRYSTVHLIHPKNRQMLHR